MRRFLPKQVRKTFNSLSCLVYLGSAILRFSVTSCDAGSCPVAVVLQPGSTPDYSAGRSVILRQVFTRRLLCLPDQPLAKRPERRVAQPVFRVDQVVGEIATIAGDRKRLNQLPAPQLVFDQK